MLTVCLAQKEDLIHLAEIELAAATLYPESYIPIEFRGQTLPKKALLQALKQDLLFCAFYEKNLVGFASCHQYIDSPNKQYLLHLDEIAVRPNFGGQGIGKKLLESVFTQCKNLKLGGVSLTTFSDLPWNAPFYQKLGFSNLREEHMPQALADILMEESFVGLKNRVAMFAPCLN